MQAEQVVVEVTDTGVGMDEEARRRCLEPFYTTKGERGTGLGLAMVYGIMQRHGGEVEIASAVGQGTTVRLVFPRSELGSAQQKQHREGQPPDRVPRLRLLLVDDDPLDDVSDGALVSWTGSSGATEAERISVAGCPSRLANKAQWASSSSCFSSLFKNSRARGLETYRTAPSIVRRGPEGVWARLLHEKFPPVQVFLLLGGEFKLKFSFPKPLGIFLVLLQGCYRG